MRLPLRSVLWVSWQPTISSQDLLEPLCLPASTSTSPYATQEIGEIEILEAVVGNPVRFRINNRPSSNDAWVGIYPKDAIDQDHGEHNKRWKWLGALLARKA